MDYIDILQTIATPVAGIVGWYAARYKRKNESIEMFQQTIDTLIAKNADLYADILQLRKRVNDLEIENKRIRAKLDENQNHK